MTQSYSKYEVPPEIKRWNWGAACFNILWGFGNKCYLPLLSFIPIFNIIWFFVCGFKGNSWAWKKGNYKNVEEFMLVQKTWNRAGIAYFIIAIIIILIYVLLTILFLDQLF
ncbi:ribonuclease G [Clostridium novyi A str. 4570]|uniref:Ribonuclease G n=1 Tax=Clostridium novyi A str. 4570 TaxID=1444290 RepID=A0AA89CNN3_CLONO|nr:ribonuclease G [Clostridium novyi A str. 4570]